MKNTQNIELLFPGGSARTVSAPGISGSGGVSSFKRTYGLTIDNIKDYQIIVPPNKTEEYKLMHLKKDDDLFWAISGGVSSNFGVVTDITYVLPVV